jgi:membrane protease YdiL (CAAX protease family)
MNNPTPLIKPGWLRAVLFILVFFAGAVSIGLVVGLLTGTTGSSAKAATNKSTITDTTIYLLLSTLLSVVLTVIFRRYIDRRPVASLGFKWDRYQHHALTGFCLAFALLGTGTLILFFHKNLQWNNVHFQPDDLFITLVMMMLVALGEEMVFRGYILRNLLQSMNKWVALVITALLFVMAHAGNPGMTAIAVINLLLGGLLLGINYIYTRNLWYALLFHFSWNFFQGPVLGYEVSGINLQSVLEPELKGPSWLTGGRFGFEGSIAATMVFIPALLILFLVYERRYGRTT